MNLIGKKIKLVPLEMDDMKKLNDMMNDPDIESMVIGWSKPVTLEEQKNWFMNLNERNTIRYAVKEEEKTVGTVIIRDIDWKNRKTSIDIKLSKEGQGKGYGKEIMYLTLNYCFNELNLHGVYVGIIEYNIASQKLVEACGYTREGITREAVYKNGKYNGIVNYSILKDEFIKKCSEK